MRRTASAWALASISLSLLVGACSGGTSEPPPPTVASVEVTPPSATKQVGETQQLSAAVKDASGTILSGQSVTWTTSSASIASVTSGGLVTAVGLGTAVITASSGNKSGTSTITVAPPPITSIVVAPTADTLLVGENVQLTVTMRDANNVIVTNRTPTWVSSAPGIASVSGTGLVTGVADGVASITASAEGKSASASIRVFGPCSTALAPTITVGQTINGALANTDCKLNDNTYADGYLITVAAATNVQIDMTASFDTYLFLLELLPTNDLTQRAANDDVDPDDPNDPNDTVNTNSRITFTLQPNALYFILANSFDANVFGNYQLKVTATSFIAGSQIVGKPGKAPITQLLKSIKVK